MTDAPAAPLSAEELAQYREHWATLDRPSARFSTIARLLATLAAARREGHAATLAVIDTEYRRLSSLANHAMSPAVAQAIHDAGVIRDLGDRIRALEPGEGAT